VVIWNASDPRRPAIERHVGAVARHRLVDLVIVPHS
jgi:hypothetical protein